MTGQQDVARRAAKLFLDAYHLEPEARAHLLRRACADDSELRVATEDLLAHHDASTPALRALEELRARPTQQPHVPVSIGPFRIAGVLGRGGMGIVYRAEQQNPQRTVALKVLQPFSAPEFGDRFRRETQLLGKLQHPGIAQIYEAGTFESEFGEMPYFTMELVDGMPIDSFCKDRGLDLRTRCALIVRLCQGVQHAHDRGIVHRDLKPGNILVTEIGGADWQPKILDFGIARAQQPDSFSSLVKTRTGELLGTLPYMSPEQVSNGVVDHRTDVYSLGVIAFELLSGRLPLDVDGRSVPDTAQAIREEAPPRLGQLDHDLKGDLEVIIDKALAKEPSRRYQTASCLREDLLRFLRSEPIQARRASKIYTLSKLVRRRRGVVASGTAVFLALVGGLLYGGRAHAPRKSNDWRADAATLDGVGRFPFELTGATLDHARSSLFNGRMPAVNVWFRWQASASGAHLVKPVGESTRAFTIFVVFEGEKSTEPIGLTHHYVTRTEFDMAAMFFAVAGKEYWISVYGSPGMRGEAELAKATLEPVVEARATFRGKTYLRIAACNWPTARAFARALGGDLASLGDAQEDEFVRHTLQHDDAVWIGASDAAKNGAFVWTDGTPFEWTRWAPGEPNDEAPGEDYVMLGLVGWNDTWGTNWIPAIVELPAK